MTVQIDHESARRHVEVTRCGGRTWMSDMEPIEIIDQLVDVFDEEVSARFTQEDVDEKVEEAKDTQKGELDGEHGKEINKLTDAHDEAIEKLRATHREEIAELLAVLDGGRVVKLDALDDGQLARMDDRELREAYRTLRSHHIHETTALLMRVGALADAPVREPEKVDDRDLPADEPHPNHFLDDSATATAPEPAIPRTAAERFRSGEGVPLEDFVKEGGFPRLDNQPEPSADASRSGEASPKPKAAAAPAKPAKAPAAPSSIGVLPIVEVVLREAGAGAALSVHEIVDRAGARLPTKSATPETVVSRDLALDIKRHGPASKFGRAAPGVFTLREARGEVAFHLDEIDAWRSGRRSSPGCPADGERYAARILDAVTRHEVALIALGHQPTIDYVAMHGLADHPRGGAVP